MVNRYAVLVLMLLAFFARGVIPAGFMPDKISSGNFITICSGLETKTIFLPGQDAPHDSQEKQNPCPLFPPLLATTDFYFPAEYGFVSYSDIPPDWQVRALRLAAVAKSYFSQGPPDKIVA